jgi:hypothetical protein
VSALSCRRRSGQKLANTLFGNPAVLNLRTRGFASPDLSGFALIGDIFNFKITFKRLFFKEKSVQVI